MGKSTIERRRVITKTMSVPPTNSDTPHAIHSAELQHVKDSITQIGTGKCWSVASRKTENSAVAVANTVTTSFGWQLADVLAKRLESLQALSVQPA
jgi:hypothetical protein